MWRRSEEFPCPLQAPHLLVLTTRYIPSDPVLLGFYGGVITSAWLMKSLPTDDWPQSQPFTPLQRSGRGVESSNPLITWGGSSGKPKYGWKALVMNNQRHLCLSHHWGNSKSFAALCCEHSLEPVTLRSMAQFKCCPLLDGFCSHLHAPLLRLHTPEGQ